MYKDNVLDPNSQKTHYSLPFPKRNAKRHQSKAVAPDLHSFFKPLSSETREHAEHRYLLYQQVWGHQKQATETILNSANKELFADLLQFIKDPVSDKLDTAFLGLGSNTANNLRILDEFTASVAEDTAASYIRIVRLNSKVCINIKNTIKEVVKQVVEDSAHEELEELDFQDSDDENNDDEGESKEEDDDDVALDDEDQTGEVDGGRIAYDFEIVQEWVEAFNKRAKPNLLRIVVVLDDSDGFSNEVLNEIIQLFCVYRCRSPIKMVMGLSSRNVSDWISSNVTSKLRTLVRGYKLEAKENKDIGFQVINAILLQNEITATNPLLLDAQLSLIILSRFENSNNSIDSLISELKLAYMIYFYQLPLASLIDPDFLPESFHYDALRKLPSFKTHVESLVHRFEETSHLLRDGLSKEVEREKKMIDSIREETLDLLQNQDKLYELFSDARARFERYQNSVMNAVNIVHTLCEGEKEKFQIYKLVTNNQLVNSAFLSDLLKKIKLYTADDVARFYAYVTGGEIKTKVGGYSDDYVVDFMEKMGATSDLVETITQYLHSNRNLNMKISDNLFNEVLTINGGISELDELKPKVSIEENYENLMINLIRPNTREILEVGLDEPQKYLRNSVLLESIGLSPEDTSSRLAGPALSRLYQIYKDAPVNINLWDFFTAFKLSLPKREVVKEILLASEEQTQDLLLEGDVAEEKWNRITYAWFIQGCFELSSMGFLKEKSKGDYVEKLIWKNL